MMRRLLAIAALLLATLASARAQVWIMSPASQMSGKAPAVTPPPTCGTGAIDLSTGCTLSIALGLVP